MKKSRIITNSPGLIFIVILFFAISACEKQTSGELTVMKGKFTESFIETGDLAAKKAIAVPMFRMDYRYGYSFKIVEMIFNGTYVNKGDTLMKLDDSPIRKFIITT